MTGERRPGQGTIAAGVVRRERSLPQPGGRPPAPGKLAVLQSFINSHFDLVVDWGADLLATREGLLKWFTARGLLDPGRAVIDDQQVRRVGALREGLSVGEIQRMVLARALASARGLLIVDEPTSHLDEANASTVGHALKEAAQSDRQTVICATHDPAVITEADEQLSLDVGPSLSPELLSR